VPVARLLLDWGANIEQRRPDDDATPLFLAARAGYGLMPSARHVINLILDPRCSS